VSDEDAEPEDAIKSVDLNRTDSELIRMAARLLTAMDLGAARMEETERLLQLYREARCHGRQSGPARSGRWARPVVSPCTVAARSSATTICASSVATSAFRTANAFCSSSLKLGSLATLFNESILSSAVARAGGACLLGACHPPP